MYKHLETKVLPLTPELATQFNGMESSPTERDLNPRRMKFLKTKIEDGHIKPFDWAVAIMPDGRRIRINGQTSSAVLCGLNGKFPTDGVVIHSEYAVENIDDVILLFRQMDARQSSRSPLDIAGAFQGGVESLRNVPRETAKIGIEGAALYLRMIEGVPSPSGDDLFGLMGRQAHHAFLQWLGTVLSQKTPELKHVAVVAAMYATFLANQDVARIFWGTEAAGPNGAADDDPAIVLCQWLMANRDEKDPKKKHKQAEVYQGCIYAWNAFRESRTITSIKPSTKKGIHEART